MEIKTITKPSILGILFTLLTACSYPIVFQGLKYPINNPHIVSGNVAVVMSPATLAQEKNIHSFTTGIAQSWDADYGEMLKQISSYEFSNMFTGYFFATNKNKLQNKNYKAIVELSVPYYDFAGYHATAIVKAQVYNANNKLLFVKTYTASGKSQAAKMWTAAILGMKSAVRQSTLDAYRQIFKKLRADIYAKIK